ncbi:hypothetical protein N658DRAFT_429511 [Parathielavia hyrcaniae]|uniref:Uncharacterized protein n=1 Tax=Parathielavia hyrcaniae TaxID=113614 RepID=A0AAN6PZT1_9PEZI|nr:hypothetical protein N658DRAFT_429511 [Parathielavia hyrcaniae]
MRVRGDTLMLSYDDDDVYYRLVSAIKLLPGLQLDQLTVLGGHGSHVNYDTLDGLIKESNGWKTLRYIGYSSAMLRFPGDPLTTYSPNYWRTPQPRHWQMVMEGRDGAASNPSVTIYLAQEPGRYGSILDPARRVKFEQKPHHSQDRRPDVFPADPELMSEDCQKRELMVIVRRGSGHGVNYKETKNSPFITADIRRDLPRMSWKEIRAKHIDDLFDDEYEEEGWPLSDDSDDPAEADVYKNVDEYLWTPLHFEYHDD